jgi:hypothetical protein
MPDEVPIGVIGKDEDWLDLDISIMAGGARHRFDRLAEVAIQEWTQKLQSFAEHSETPALYRLSRDQAQILCNELTRAANRVGLREMITDELHSGASYVQRSVAASQRIAMILEQKINNFVHLLSFDRLAPDDRPPTPRGDRRIFAPRLPVVGIPSLGQQPSAYDQSFLIDWIVALQSAIEANVTNEGESAVDIVQNTRLGQILARLSEAA